MEQYLWILWLCIFVIALVVESLTSEVVSIWFAFSAIVSLIVSFIPNVAWYIELILFLVISVASMLSLRPLMKRFMKKEIVNSNVDEFINKRVKLIKAIKNDENGEIKIKGIIYNAISNNEKEIEEGTEVQILAIEGNKLIVREINN